MARPILLVLSILLLVPYQAQSRSTPKTGDGLPLLDKEEEAVAGEEGVEAQRQRWWAACEGRWIHIRDLPPRFNTDLLRSCNNFPLYDDGDFCLYLANNGLGPRTHNRSRSWYRTDPHMLEPLFHRRILEYPCLTPDPALADAVFLPYYASLDSLPFLYNPELFNLHGRDLADFLCRDRPAVWARRGGRRGGGIGPGRGAGGERSAVHGRPSRERPGGSRDESREAQRQVNAIRIKGFQTSSRFGSLGFRD